MFWKKKKVQKRTVLFVDDDKVVLLSLQNGLTDTSYDKLFATDYQEALEILSREEVHVIVTDMNMPEKSGLELLRTARADHPDIIGIVLTGYQQDPDLQSAFNQGEIFKLIPKPWKFAEVDFERIVRAAIDRYNSQKGIKVGQR
jgi:CheY-like chemotaxis protein